MTSTYVNGSSERPRPYTGLAYAGVILGVALVSGAIGAGQSPDRPQLRRQGTATQLMVDGRPFLIRGGELGNSSASSLEYLAPFWPIFGELHLNTLLVPVSWDLIEPEEGRFDFTLVDGIVGEARARGLRLVLLWFGTWKNSMSC